MSGDAERVVSAYIDACNGDDVAAVIALLHPEVELHEADTLPGAVHAIGREQVSRYLERFEAHWTKFHWTPVEVRSAGENRVLMLARLELEGRTSGITVDREWAYVFEVKDGLLLRQDGYDSLAAAEAAV